MRVCLPTLLLLVTASACVAPGVAHERVLTQHVYIAADYDTVWQHLTQRERFASWFTVPCREFSTRPGDPVVFGTDERVIYRGQMVRCDKGRGLAFAFRFEGFGFGEPEALAEIDVLERGDTVLVSVCHDLSDAPQTAAMISTVGWAKPLCRLKTLLETGRAMPWPEEPAIGN
ncbi:MAG: SRPBCC domain-containing protein [bacterium]|nr:SRPBCC domain-containing protein [bacterium]